MNERLRAFVSRHRVPLVAGLAFVGLAFLTYERVPASRLPVPLRWLALLPAPLDALAFVDWTLLALLALLVGGYRLVTLRVASPRWREDLHFALLVAGLLVVVAVLSFRPATGLNVRFLTASLLVPAFVYALFALGLNLEFGQAGLVNFGHVAFLALGAYTTVLLSLEAGWPLAGAALGGTLVAAFAGLLLGLPTVKLREDYLAIVTIGAAEVLRLVILNEAWLTEGARGVTNFPTPFSRAARGDFAGRVAEAVRGSPGVLVFLGFAALVFFAAFAIYELLVRSPWGRVLKAVREDEEVAASLGKNVFAYKLQSLALGSAVAGLAGAMFAWSLGTIHPDMFGHALTFEAWIIIVLGGAGNNKGVLLGGMLFWTFHNATGLLEFYERLGLSQPQGAALRIALIGALLILVMRFKPEGLLGRKEELPFAR